VVLEKDGDHLDRRVKSKEVLHRVKKANHIISIIKSRKANLSAHILRRNRLLNTLLQGR